VQVCKATDRDKDPAADAVWSRAADDEYHSDQRDDGADRSEHPPPQFTVLVRRHASNAAVGEKSGREFWGYRPSALER